MDGAGVAVEEAVRRVARAVSFLRRRREFCSEVAEGADVQIYAIDQMCAAMIDRCRDLKLRLGLTENALNKKC